MLRKRAARRNSLVERITHSEIPVQKIRIQGPKYWRSVWKRVVEELYGDTTAALRWMQAPLPELGGAPVEIAVTPEGRARILQLLDQMRQGKAQSKPRTVWRTCQALYPSPVNGELLFRNTEIPVVFLFHDLARERTIKDFVREYPGVTQQQVDMVLRHVAYDLCDF